ncbi:hypothetical protein QFZ67_004989 [Streptomyces sp. V1I1]|nr:hypothetical protein [Streptomyces sp. V1I1]
MDQAGEARLDAEDDARNAALVTAEDADAVSARE